MFKKFFRKKEKPVRTYGIFEIGRKALCTKYFTYTPTKIECYSDRVEFTVEVLNTPTGEVTTDVIEVTATAKLTGERLVPLEIDGRELFWDTVDMAVRRKVMPEGEAIEIAPPIHMYRNEVLTIKRDFAEKYLSYEALSYAILQDDDRYIWYYPDGSCSPAVLEIPTAFDAFRAFEINPLSSDPIEVSSYIGVYAGEYFEKKGISTSNYTQVYMENRKRELNFD